MSISTFKLYKKLSNELRFKYSELEYVDQECVEGNIEFEKYYREFCNKHNISISDLESKNSEKVEKLFPKKAIIPENEDKIVETHSTDEHSNKKKIFQRIYRSIAKKIHPDKFSNLEKTPDIIKKEEMFKRATSALEEQKWGTILEIAEELDIHPQKYTKVNELLREEISEVNKEIVAKQKSFGWMFSQAETDDQRDKVIISFLKTLFNYTFNP